MFEDADICKGIKKDQETSNAAGTHKYVRRAGLRSLIQRRVGLNSLSFSLKLFLFVLLKCRYYQICIRPG
jgi:hypothetical protein